MSPTRKEIAAVLVVAAIGVMLLRILEPRASAGIPVEVTDHGITRIEVTPHGSVHDVLGVGPDAQVDAIRIGDCGPEIVVAQNPLAIGRKVPIGTASVTVLAKTPKLGWKEASRIITKRPRGEGYRLGRGADDALEWLDQRDRGASQPDRVRRETADEARHAASHAWLP